jgi:leucyl aminopeptidase
MDDGFSKKHKISQRIYNAGHIMADPFEISTFRREDVACVKPGRTSEDVVQANDKPSTLKNRGHQCPTGFIDCLRS